MFTTVQVTLAFISITFFVFDDNLWAPQILSKLYTRQLCTHVTNQCDFTSGSPRHFFSCQFCENVFYNLRIVVKGLKIQIR